MSGGPLLQIGEVSGERRIISLDGPRVVAECLRCGAIETPWRIAFRQSPGPCLACRVAERKAAIMGGIGMRYSDARPEIKSGDLIAFRGRGLFPWVIRAVTRSAYDHVAIAWAVGGRVLLLESRIAHGGVTIQRALSQALQGIHAPSQLLTRLKFF